MSCTSNCPSAKAVCANQVNVSVKLERAETMRELTKPTGIAIV